MRKWLYKKNVEPTIFKGKEAIDDAIANGWQPRPIGSKTPADTMEAVVVKTPIKTKESKTKAKESDEDKVRASQKEDKTKEK